MNFDHQQCLEDTQTDGRACPRNSEPLKCEELDTDSPIVSPRIGSNRLQPWSNFNRWLWNRASMGIPVIHWFIGLSSLSQQPFWQHAPIFRQAQWTSISSCWYICCVSHDIPLKFIHIWSFQNGGTPNHPNLTMTWYWNDMKRPWWLGDPPF